MLRNRIIVFTILISSSILVYHNPNFISLLLFYSITVLIFFSAVHLLLAKRNLIISQKVNPLLVSHGDNTKYTLKIYNESFFPYAKTIVQFMYTGNLFLDQISDLELTLYPDENLVLNFDISSKYRGNYSLGVRQVIVYDILNIFRLSISVKELKKLRRELKWTI